MKQCMGKYYRKISVRALDPEDLDQVFRLACYEAILTARTDVGNPLAFILKQGQYRVVDELRKFYRRSIKQFCHSCCNETQLYQRGGVVQCPKCGAGPESVERIDLLPIIDDNFDLAGSIDIQQEIEDSAIIDEFRQRLEGRKRDVFVMIVDRGFDRDSCKNYMQEVADELGISKSNVNLRLRAIKAQLVSYLDEIGD